MLLEFLIAFIGVIIVICIIVIIASGGFGKSWVDDMKMGKPTVVVQLTGGHTVKSIIESAGALGYKLESMSQSGAYPTNYTLIFRRRR